MGPAPPRFYLDTEFNGFGGQLISMALVGEDATQVFYEVLPPPERIDPWVNEHVMPILGKPPIMPNVFLLTLRAFITKHNGMQVFADWPEDFTHFCQKMTLMGASDAFKMPITCTMYLVHSGDLKPDLPHNALSDARALRNWHVEQERLWRGGE